MDKQKIMDVIMTNTDLCESIDGQKVISNILDAARQMEKYQRMNLLRDIFGDSFDIQKIMNYI